MTINNAGFRRATLLAHPLPDATGAHMSMLQSEAIARAGGRFLFEPRMHVIHCRNCVRSAGDYGVSWWELPIAFCFAARACMLEAAGMMRAVRELPDGPSEFR